MIWPDRQALADLGVELEQKLVFSILGTRYRQEQARLSMGVSQRLQDDRQGAGALWRSVGDERSRLAQCAIGGDEKRRSQPQAWVGRSQNKGVGPTGRSQIRRTQHDFIIWESGEQRKDSADLLEQDTLAVGTGQCDPKSAFERPLNAGQIENHRNAGATPRRNGHGICGSRDARACAAQAADGEGLIGAVCQHENTLRTVEKRDFTHGSDVRPHQFKVGRIIVFHRTPPHCRAPFPYTVLYLFSMTRMDGYKTPQKNQKKETAHTPPGRKKRKQGRANARPPLLAFLASWRFPKTLKQEPLVSLMHFHAPHSAIRTARDLLT